MIFIPLLVGRHPADAAFRMSGPVETTNSGRTADRGGSEVITHGYFKPLRRKIGVLTLALACLLVVGWVRSETYSDCFSFPLSKGIDAELSSENGYLLFERTVANDKSVWTSVFWMTLFSCDPSIVYYRDNSVGWRFAGFAAGEHVITNSVNETDFEDGPVSLFQERRTWFVSYWTIISPLTLLSAWLLLSKPQAKKPESWPTEGT